LRTLSACAALFFFFFLRGNGSVVLVAGLKIAGLRLKASGSLHGAVSVRGGLEKASKLDAAGGGGGEATLECAPSKQARPRGAVRLLALAPGEAPQGAGRGGARR